MRTPKTLLTNSGSFTLSVMMELSNNIEELIIVFHFQHRSIIDAGYHLLNLGNDLISILAISW
jgi:hypothetical protein